MFQVRLAEKKDSQAILDMINKLAVYEKMGDEVVNSTNLIEKVVFDNNGAKTFLAVEDDKVVGFALFYETYSTFQGIKGIHLEDLYVEEFARGKGYGKALFKAVAAFAVENGYGRMEWCCLDWNTPSQKFYDYMGGEHLEAWWTYRLSGKTLADVKNK